LKRAQTPKLLVTGISLEKLSKSHFMDMNIVTEGFNGQWGTERTLFDKKSKRQVKIGAAVYSTVAKAEDAVLDMLNSISVILKTGSKTGGTIGTHSWYDASRSGSGTVVFTYYNAVFHVFSSNYALSEMTAKSILNDFKKGMNGIYLGLKVNVPQVRDVSIPAEIKQSKETTMQIDAIDPNQQKLSFFVTTSKSQVKETVDRTKRVIIPAQEGSDEIRVYAINKLNVVSEVYVKSLKIGR
jgi:hypothetical protein